MQYWMTWHAIIVLNALLSKIRAFLWDKVRKTLMSDCEIKFEAYLEIRIAGFWTLSMWQNEKVVYIWISSGSSRIGFRRAALIWASVGGGTSILFKVGSWRSVSIWESTPEEPCMQTPTKLEENLLKIIKNVHGIKIFKCCKYIHNALQWQGHLSRSENRMSLSLMIQSRVYWEENPYQSTFVSATTSFLFTFR